MRSIERFTRTQIIDGAVVGRVWSFRDVTERKNAEDALRDETRVLELEYSLGVMVWVVGVLGGALLVAFSGWLATRSVVSQPPLATLRA